MSGEPVARRRPRRRRGARRLGVARVVGARRQRLTDLVEDAGVRGEQGVGGRRCRGGHPSMLASDVERSMPSPPTSGRVAGATGRMAGMDTDASEPGHEAMQRGTADEGDLRPGGRRRRGGDGGGHRPGGGTGRAPRRCSSTRRRRRGAARASGSQRSARPARGQGPARAVTRLTRPCERLATADSVRHLPECGLVIEAVPEDLAPQAAAASPICRSSSRRRRCWRPTPRASASTPIARDALDPERVLGLHFFNPPPVMRARRGGARRADLARPTSSTRRR